MRKLKYGLLASAAALAVAVALPMTASAWGGKGGHGGKIFEMLDTDKDGAVSAAEMQARSEERFTQADADGDGYVTAEEMTKAHEAMRAQWQERRAGMMEEGFTTADADGDGKVTLQEMQDAMAKRMADRKMPEHMMGGEEMRGERHAERMETRFNAMDADKDGAVTLAEMQAAPHPMRGGADGKPGRGDRFARLDADGDSRVSKDEFAAGHQKMFERMDRNGDGKIERDEMRGGHGKNSKSE